jgi:hypothetical protein
MRTNEVVAAMSWDSIAWKLNRENPDIKFINPKSGAIFWLDTFALPARGRMTPGCTLDQFHDASDVAAKIAVHRKFHGLAGRRAHGSSGATAELSDGFKNTVWYPAAPGLEEIEAGCLDRIKAANWACLQWPLDRFPIEGTARRQTIRRARCGRCIILQRGQGVFLDPRPVGYGKTTCRDCQVPRPTKGTLPLVDAAWPASRRTGVSQYGLNSWRCFR